MIHIKYRCFVIIDIDSKQYNNNNNKKYRSTQLIKMFKNSQEFVDGNNLVNESYEVI